MPNIRVPNTTHAALKAMASRSGETMQDVLVIAVRDLQRKRLLEEVNRGFARLKADPKAWAEELDERRAWNVTLSDGLDD